MSDDIPDLDDTMTIRQMCAKFGVTARTLRFYESKELLAPIRIGQKRLFTRRDRARLKLIQMGKRFGFSLEEIRKLLDLYHTEGGQERQLEEALRAARARMKDLERQRDELERAISDLKDTMRWGERMLAEIRDGAKPTE